MTNDNIDKSTPLKLIAISTGGAEARYFRRSFDWKLFETGKDHYENEYHDTFYYQPEWISARGKYALLFDIVMAFNEEAAKNEYARWKLDTDLATVDQRSDQEITKEAAMTEESRSKVWFRTRTKFLRERTGSPWNPWGSSHNNKHDGIACEFYNVLWIECREGVSYRRACGWVAKTHLGSPCNRSC
jgi:hypothetical protein